MGALGLESAIIVLLAIGKHDNNGGDYGGAAPIMGALPIPRN